MRFTRVFKYNKEEQKNEWFSTGGYVARKIDERPN